MAGLLKLIFNLIILLVIITAAYAISLLYHVLPIDYTPRELFKSGYPHFKQDLTTDAASKDATAGVSGMVLGLLNNIEKTYNQSGSTAKAKPVAQTNPMMRAPTTAAPMPATAPSKTTPAPAATSPAMTPNAPAKPAVAPAPTMAPASGTTTATPATPAAPAPSAVKPQATDAAANAQQNMQKN